VGFEEIGRADVALAGGKGAQLAELARIDGIDVPDGFVVTTESFRRDSDDLAAEIAARLEDGALYAVRSSATAEDLPTASFAGLHDSFLDVAAPDVLDAVRRCWASLLSERAVAYRLRNGIDERDVAMAVVVQRMVDAQAAGVLFTADPLTGNRKVAAVEAVAGLGEALVSGRADADGYAVRDGEVVARTIRGAQPVLTNAQVVRLVELGRRIEAHFGRPQDVEWCLAGDGFAFVQTRPITTLFPIPPAAGEGNHVYVSVGHQQMMTDAMKPLGLSLWQLTTPRPMAEAGGRLFVDVTAALGAPTSRAGLLEVMGRSDPLLRDALESVLARGDFVPELPDEEPAQRPPWMAPEPIDADAALVAELIAATQESIAAAARGIADTSGPALLDFVLDDLQELRRVLFDPRSHQVFMTAMEAAFWLNEHVEEWLGETNAADVLTQSVPTNVTSEMGLALLDVADAIRPYPEVVALLEAARDDAFVDALPEEPRAALDAWLERYGMRCVGEIDVTRPRWRERPAMLLPMLLANVRNFERGEAARRFEQGRNEAEDAERQLLARLRALPGGEEKATETKRMIDRVRTFIGYREYPKYGMVSRYFVYKQALLREADRLVEAGVLDAREDVFWLRLQELHDVVRTGQVDAALIRERRDAFAVHETLAPPRALTSDGEALTGSYRRGDAPAGALPGLAVSAGVAEGRARVVHDVAEAELEPGDILVTPYTDPSFTPLFVAIEALVTEVGGVMTHGAVIAREYGLPAVVGVVDATRLIRDGQRIRVDGSRGHVELLD
jgi:pyruvate,water dikinase